MELNPRNDYCLVSKGNSLKELNQYEEALECYNKAIAINPETDYVLLKKRILLLQSNRYEEALECYEKALEINPSNFVNREGNMTNVHLFESINTHDSISATVTTNDEHDELKVFDLLEKIRKFNKFMEKTNPMT